MQTSRTPIAAIVALGLAACGEPSTPVVAQCVEQCEAADECADGTGDCLGNCEAELDQAQKFGCELEYQGLLDCIGDAADVCDSQAECGTRVTDYTTCFGEYCGLHPEDALCSPGSG